MDTRAIKLVWPKRVALAAAQATMNEAMAVLEVKRGKLREVEAKMAKLQEVLNTNKEKKMSLEFQVF